MSMKNNSNEFEKRTMEPLAPNKKVRVEWSNDAQAISRDGFDDLWLDDFSNLDDHKFKWWLV